MFSQFLIHVILCLVILFFPSPITSQLPSSVDWRLKGVVPPITNQGELGYSVVYSAISAMESAWAIKTGKLVSLSIQNLLDCAADQPQFYTLQGCVNYVLKNGGIDSTASYPSNGSIGTCHYDPSGRAAYFTKSVTVSNGNEDQLAQVVATVGPVAVNVDASNWELYDGGIDTSPCISVDHTALVVGYTKDYWIVMNSWGTSWGMDGYIEVARNKNDSSCIASGGIALVA
eukprot:TRINITY_DN235_c0_g1_i2.p1 TRINITY_DN235_c0_g1~~TRINITY_DN235_c0_g1_i2.p1  ORF type:complete len:230 (+),score=47.89 TRINITY_DN235_c0_g1_i2:38-727(+)